MDSLTPKPFAELAYISKQERAVYWQLFQQADTGAKGFVTGQEAVTHFKKSLLPDAVLSQIWQMVDVHGQGVLRSVDFAKAMRLIAMAQSQRTPDLSQIEKPLPLPKFPGAYEAPPAQVSNTSRGALSASGSMLALQTTAGASSTASLAAVPGFTLTADEQARYTDTFHRSNPKNGLLDGASARNAFLLSRLPDDQLALIWNLVDVKKIGAVNVVQFCVAMLLIQRRMTGTPIPPSLPAAVEASFFAGADSADTVATPPSAAVDWVISDTERVKLEALFATLDTRRTGFLTGAEAAPFFIKSGLNEASLAEIWNLADYDKSGRLDKAKFAVATFLVQRKMAGATIPATLPSTLMPARSSLNAYSGHAGSMSTPAIMATGTLSRPPPADERGSFVEKERTLSSKMTELASVQQQAASATAELDEWKAKRVAVEGRIQAFDKQLEEQHAALVTLRASREQEMQAFNETLQKFAAVKRTVAELEARIEVEQRDLDGVRQRMAESQKWLNKTQQTADQAQSKLDELLAENRRLTAALDSDKHLYEKANERAQTTSQALAAAQKQNADLQAQKQQRGGSTGRIAPAAADKHDLFTDFFDMAAPRSAPSNNSNSALSSSTRPSMTVTTIGSAPAAMTTTGTASAHNEPPLASPQSATSEPIQFRGTSVSDLDASNNGQLVKVKSTKSDNGGDVFDSDFFGSTVLASNNSQPQFTSSNSKESSAKNVSGSVTFPKSNAAVTADPFADEKAASLAVTIASGDLPEGRSSAQAFDAKFPSIDDFEQSFAAIDESSKSAGTLTKPSPVKEAAKKNNSSADDEFADFNDAFSNLDTTSAAPSPKKAAAADFGDAFFTDGKSSTFGDANPFGPPASGADMAGVAFPVDFDSGSPFNAAAPSSQLATSSVPTTGRTARSTASSTAARKFVDLDNLFGGENTSTAKPSDNDNPFAAAPSAAASSFFDDPFGPSAAPAARSTAPKQAASSTTSFSFFDQVAESTPTPSSGLPVPTFPSSTAVNAKPAKMPAPGGNSGNTNSEVDRITQMGFSEEDARAALARHNNNVVTAIESLLEGGDSGAGHDLPPYPSTGSAKDSASVHSGSHPRQDSIAADSDTASHKQRKQRWWKSGAAGSANRKSSYAGESPRSEHGTQ